ncbi:MAG: hypothetical protein KAS32_11890 [Candidatus Peribacteraceae bacterium]|nr:hypothetical protein [Candidatus Peribacteraceae bacterium]
MVTVYDIIGTIDQLIHTAHYENKEVNCIYLSRNLFMLLSAETHVVETSKSRCLDALPRIRGIKTFIIANANNQIGIGT